MSEFIDLGRKPQETSAVPESKVSSKIYYPSFYVDNKGLPISDNDVGKTVIAQVKLQVTSVEKRVTKDKNTYDTRFDVLGISFPSKQVAGG